MKRTALAATAAVLLLALTGCAGAADPAGPETAAPSASDSAGPAESADPLVAEEPVAAGEGAYLEFVRGRLATFPSQIPNATDEQLLAAADDACNRIAAGELVEKMSVIEGEKPSEVGGYFYDSNAIITGAQMHICAAD